MFELESQTNGPILTLILKSDVLFEDAVNFNDTMRGYSKTPNITHLILDLAQAGNMDNAALGVLVSLNTSMQRYGKKLVLLHPAPHFNKLMQDAEIEGLFPTCESIEELKGIIPRNDKVREHCAGDKK